MKVSQTTPATQAPSFSFDGPANEADWLRLALLALQRDGTLGSVGRAMLRALDAEAAANRTAGR